MAGKSWRVACIAIGLSMVSLVLAIPEDVGAISTRDTILIDGNQEFTAENGVTGGSGTAVDPYIIEGWEIHPTANPGIHILRTTAHFVIRDVVIQSGSIWPGQGQSGIVLEHVSNFEIDSAEISNCPLGIGVYLSADGVIEGCNVHDTLMGIALSYSRAIMMQGNTLISSMVKGIELDSCDACAVLGNVMMYNSGLGIHYSRGTTVSGNVMTQNGIGITGRSLIEFCSHTITTDNLVSGLPVYYYTGVIGMRLEGVQAGEIILAGCRDVELVGLTIAASTAGVEIAWSTSVTLDSCVLQGNGNGLSLWFANAIDVQDCQFIGNRYGIGMYYSDHVNIVACQFSENTEYAVNMYRSSFIFVGESTFLSNWFALYVQECSRVIVSGNVINGNAYGVNVYSCSKVSVLGNQIASCAMSGWGTGLSIWDSTKSVVIRNDFIGNEINANANDAGDVLWDDGVSCGNYWDDYTGTDANNDLIGDTPYVIDADDQDNFPHMVLFN